MSEIEKTKKRAAGATEKTKTEAEVKGKIIEFAWDLKKNGYSEGTIRTYSSYLILLLKAGAYLLNPEKVKEVIARKKWSENTKFIATNAYRAFLKFLGIMWKPPRYRQVLKIPFIPTEEEINQLIAASGRKLAAFLRMLKETGMRCGEALMLEWTDIELQRRTVRITAEKGSYPRIMAISEDLTRALSLLPKKSAKIFPMTQSAMQGNLYKIRKEVAVKMNNPRLLKISFHTLRHWKGTMEYHKTKDILHVKQLLGHRSIKSTMLYIHIDKALFTVKSDEFHVKVAAKPEEIRALLEAGFEYVCHKDGLMFFRKRK